MNAPLLSVQSLNAFYGASQILHGVSLDVSAGEQVALIGRNGMGKTTFIKSLMGLGPRREGSVRVNGQDLGGAPPEKIARAGVALVPEGRGVFGSLSVIENLVMAARPGRGGKSAWNLERVLTLFPRLAERRANGGHQLSGGEQQMLAIGRALMTNPEIVLIDEAAEGLAPLIAEKIWETLRSLKKEGIAAITIDKDVASLASFASRFAILSKGVIVWTGTPVELRARPELLEQHLGV